MPHPALADALAQAEEQVKTLTSDVAGMEGAKDHAFTPPPRAWIADRLGKLDDLLSKRTETAALTLRGLTGPVTLTPEVPEVGRPLLHGLMQIQCVEPTAHRRGRGFE